MFHGGYYLTLLSHQILEYLFNNCQNWTSCNNEYMRTTFGTTQPFGHVQKIIKLLQLNIILNIITINLSQLYNFCRQIRPKRADLPTRNWYGNDVLQFIAQRRDQGYSSVRGEVTAFMQHFQQYRRRAQKQPGLLGGTIRHGKWLKLPGVYSSHQVIEIRVRPVTRTDFRDGYVSTSWYPEIPMDNVVIGQ